MGGRSSIVVVGDVPRPARQRGRAMGSRWTTRAAVLASAPILALAVSCANGRGEPAALARVHVVANGDVPKPDGALPVRYQSLDEPQLDQLARREHLRELVAGIPRQFDQMRRLQDWVNAQWPDGTPTPYPPWNALTVLDWIRSGRTGGFCAQYAQVFLQSLAALGYTARYIEIGSRDNPYAHYLTEVWSNDYDKWVVMDPDFNVHFERGGVPLSALEIHDALVSSALADVVAVFDRARPHHATPASWPQHTAELYAYLRYHLNADHLSRPRDAAFDRFNDMIEFADPRVPAWEVSAVASPFPRERLTSRRITDRRFVSAKLNQVAMAVQHAAGARVTIALRDNVVQRAGYEYRLTPAGMSPAPWQTTARSTLTLPMPDAGGLIEVRGVNVRGVAGPSASLSIDPAPAASPAG